MRNFFSFIAFCLICIPVLAVTNNSQSRRSMTTQLVRSAPRATASTNQISAMANANSSTNAMSSVRVPVGADNSDSTNTEEPGDLPAEPEDNNADYEKQRKACLSNNIGVGNTFVWASRYSNVNNYSSMVEDVNEPENNICFVLVNIKSSDSNINVSDVPEKYFPMGQNITCGSWADEETLRKRILDSKKTARTWATVGGAVGGAGLGVGIMELFGNRLIGGAVEGQKGLKGDEQLLAQLRALKKQSPSEFDQIMSAFETLKTECDAWEWDGKPTECTTYNYEYLLNARN